MPPMGKGTYGSRRGRPPKKKKTMKLASRSFSLDSAK